MTLILRSNAVSTGSVGNVHGYNGAPDYRAMLDFSRGDYYVLNGLDRVDYELDEILEVTRASPGSFFDEKGNLHTVPPNAPRLHYMDDVGAKGLLIEATRTNYVVDDSNGATVNIPNATEGVIFSYYGSGNAALAAPALTLAETYSVAGRTVKRYTRTSGAISATLSVTGQVSRVQAELWVAGMYASTPLGLGGVRQGDTAAKLGAPIAALLGGEAGTVLIRRIFHQSGVNDTRGGVRGVSIRAAAGGIYSSATTPKPGNGTAFVSTTPDNSAGTNRGSVTGTYSRSQVEGVSFSGNGSQVGLICFGQQVKAAAAGYTLGTPENVYVGAAPGASNVGGIITHVVVYDRMLSDTEAWAAANQWL